MYILGINAHHPDASAALVADGRLVAACEEERLRRIKHFAGFPREAIRYCLGEGGISIEDVDYIAVPRKPHARLCKKLYYGATIPSLARYRLPAWKRIFQLPQELSTALGVEATRIKAPVRGIEHHTAHLASSFFTSGFDKAFLFSADALGDFASTVWGSGKGNRITTLGEITFPHSLGFYYTAITQYLGFLEFGDEYKVMGLAAHGEPAYEEEFNNILQIGNRTIRLNLKYFLHHKHYITMNFTDGSPDIGMLFSGYLEERLGSRRMPDEPLQKRHKDIACSLQKRLNEALLYLVSIHAPKTCSSLCLAGGVAYNCAANGTLSEAHLFDDIYVPPAPGDAGLAVGAALYLWHQQLGNPRSFVMKSAYWGPSCGDIAGDLEQMRGALEDAGYVVEKTDSEDTLCRDVASHIASGKVVGWYQGRMEWGPRALGNRSILADPRKQKMIDILNAGIKNREPFRPFAPSVLEEDAEDYFEGTQLTPFMSFTRRVKEERKNSIPAVLNVDGTARLQTVDKDVNHRYWKLIREFKKTTGVPLVLNTSFNENEPIVCTPTEAISCFMRTNMDVLVLGDHLIQKKQSKNA